MKRVDAEEAIFKEVFPLQSLVGISASCGFDLGKNEMAEGRGYGYEGRWLRRYIYSVKGNKV